jgi:purine-nucleoside phosphorylase
MYTTHTADDFRKFIGLPENYTVDGLLAYGVWDLKADKHLPPLRAALEEKGIEYTLQRFDKSIVGHGYELIIGGKHYWFIPVMGTAVMSTYIHTASMLGSKRNILLGMVGGLAPGMQSADYVIPTTAQGNDNARMYDRNNAANLYSPDEKLLASLKSKIPADQKVWEGPTTTCEILYAETKEDVEAWSKAGFLGVEMEAALFFAASKHFNIPSVALFYVADNLIESQTLLSEKHVKTKVKREQAQKMQYEIGLELIIEA